MDGMGDLDNAPMPPMGADDVDMGEPNGIGDDPMGGGGMPEGPDMGEEPPMDGEPPMDEPDDMGNSEDDELMDIINNLSIEDKAAVTKYAKSMVDDSEGGDEEPQDMGGDMPMESRRRLKSIIDEALNDVLDDREGIKRPETKLPKQYRNIEHPFKSPF